MDFLKGFNWVVVLGIVVAIETQIGNGSMSLTNMVPDSWIPFVKAWAANLGSIGALIMSAGSFGPRPQGQVTITPSMKSAIMVAFALGGLLMFGGDAHAAGKLKTPDQIFQDIGNQVEATKQQVTNAVDPTTPLPCTFNMLIKLTPVNLLTTIKQCVAEKLVSDTQRALDSATKYGSTGKGDADAINCLTPALAIFQAGVETPAVPEVPAVLNPDGSVKTPGVAAVPAQDPGPILLYQKYREFTLSGALTACQSWFNGPINATAAAGIAGVGTVVGAAAVLAPK